MPPTKPKTDRTLTEAQQRVYDQLAAFIQANGFPPSMRELGQEIGGMSVNAIRQHLILIEAKGMIKRNRKCARGIVLTPRVEHVGNSIRN